MTARRTARHSVNLVRVAGALLASGLLAAPASAQISAGTTGDEMTGSVGRSAYQLIDFPSGPLLRIPQPVGQLRLEATALFGARHEVRYSTWTVGRGGLDSLPGVSLATLASESTQHLDSGRATYRYTFLTQRDWSWKLGVSANVGELRETLRPAFGTSDRPRFGALPLVHIAGEGQLAPRWRLAFDADGLMTARGRTLDLGLRVHYSLSSNFLLFGGYRVTDSVGEAEEFYGPGSSSTANFGLRYRF